MAKKAKKSGKSSKYRPVSALKNWLRKSKANVAKLEKLIAHREGNSAFPQ